MSSKDRVEKPIGWKVEGSSFNSFWHFFKQLVPDHFLYGNGIQRQARMGQGLVLLLTALGSFLALDSVEILGEGTRKQLNNVVFFVFNPAMVASNLARTMTLESMRVLWFMPINILGTFVFGSVLAWILIKITRPPQHLKGLILGFCSAGNMGNLPIIIIPAVCKERGSPFGAPDVCHAYGMAYASLSMAIGALYLWSYVYNIMRVCSHNAKRELNKDDLTSKCNSTERTGKLLHEDLSEALLPSKDGSSSLDVAYQLMVPTSNKSTGSLKLFIRKINLKALLAPSTIGAAVGFIIGAVRPIRKLIIGGSAPLRVIEGSASMLGDAAMPTITLIVGGNLLKGLKGSGVQPSVILGIIAVRYIVLPSLGIIIVKTAVSFGLVHSDPLYQFVLLLQYAVPPAMNLGSITQLFKVGETECSVILLWTYGVASISLTLWSTFFMWLVT